MGLVPIRARREDRVGILDRAEQYPGLLGLEVGWASTLAEVINGDDRFRSNVWAGVGRALAGLDLAAVRRRFDPPPGKGFDPETFLASSGTLYLLAEEDDPASRLLQCLVDDITRVAKAKADRSPRGRLDPPLTLMLDEIANFAPLPKLPVFVSAYGGTGIVTFVVIQSRQQMNRTWGQPPRKRSGTPPPSKASSAASPPPMTCATSPRSPANATKPPGPPRHHGPG